MRLRGAWNRPSPAGDRQPSESRRQPHNHPRGCGRPSRPAMLTLSRPFLVVGCGGPLALAGAKGAGFFCANPREIAPE